MKDYKITAEGGQVIYVLAKNKEDAYEEYWKALHSMLAHQDKVCSCFGDEKPLDRSKYSQPVKAELVDELHSKVGSEKGQT